MADYNSDIAVPPPDPPDPPNNPTNQQIHHTTTSSSSTTFLSPMADTVEHASSSPNSSSSTPPWIIWSRGLNALLDDPQGQDLFKAYLEEEGCYLQLTFLWACEGLKCTAINDPPKIPDLVRKIYRVFIPNLIGLTDSTRSELAQAIVDGRFTEIEIFYTAENEVLTHMKENLYPNFLKSEIYLSACNAEDSSSGSGSGIERRQSEGDESIASVDEEHDHHMNKLTRSHEQQGILNIDPLTGDPISNISLASFENVQQIVLPTTNQLQTVHEDKELSTAAASAASQPGHSSKSKKHFGLTKEALLATEFHRATEFQAKARKSGDAAGGGAGSSTRYFVKHVAVPHSIPFPYHASYSSYNPVSRVDSEIQSMSSDAMTDDGSTASRRRHGHNTSDQQRRHDHRSHCRGGNGGDPKVPHYSHPTDRSRQHLSGMRQGAPLNTTDDLKRLPSEGVIFCKSRSTGAPDPEKDPQGFANVIIEKLQMIEQRKMAASAGDNYKDILAQAISKIHSQEEESPSDIIDMHLARVTYLSDVTPKSKSPKLRSPTIGRRRGPLPAPPPMYPAPPTRRRDRDFVTSTFSVDSGNVPDSESLAFQDTESSQVMQMSKSRSVPHELRGQQEFRRPPPMPFGGANPRGYHHPPRGFLGKVPLGMFKKPTSMDFIDSGISTVSGQSTNILPPPGHQHVSSTTEGPFPDRRIQDWVAQSHSVDPQRRMRKLNAPEHEDLREKLVQSLDLHSSSSRSGHQQITAHPRHSPPSSSGLETVPESSTNGNYVHTLVFYDDNHDVPYVLKVPRMDPRMYGKSGVTLAALKERLPRQGQFRYFFRTECVELGSKIVQEEVSDNHQELPMLNGKIFAHLKAIPPGTMSS